MAPIRSLETYIRSLLQLQTNVEDVLNGIRQAKRVSDERFSSGYGSPGGAETSINAILSGLNDLLGTEIASVVSKLAISIEVWGVIAGNRFMGDSRLWKSTSVDVDDGASGSTLTANQDVTQAIFTVFEVADVVKITNAEDPNHNETYTVAAVTGQILTFDDTMLGKDNANDETMIVTLVERT